MPRVFALSLGNRLTFELLHCYVFVYKLNLIKETRRKRKKLARVRIQNAKRGRERWNVQQTSFEVNCDTLSESLVSGMVATAHISSLCLRIIIKLSRILKVLENIFRVKVQLETDILTLATFKCETQMECQPLWKIDCMDIYRSASQVPYTSVKLAYMRKHYCSKNQQVLLLPQVTHTHPG